MNLLTAVSHYAEGSILAAQCIPSNGILSDPLGPVFRDVAGALGDLLLPLTIVIVVLAAAGAIASILTKNASKFFRAMLAAPAVLIGLFVIIIVIVGVVSWVSNACVTSPFALA